jgi:hypothetical protein
MMRKLRKLADLTGWTVEDLIQEGILQFVAKCEVETKIIRLPMRRAKSCQEPDQINAHLRSPTA